MRTVRSLTHVLRLAGAALVFAAAGIAPAVAADAPDNAAEHEVLAAVVRQLDLLDRLAERAAAVSPPERARYHFDHSRLREDVKRMRAGVQDYLIPQRAQPRDPVPLAADYTRGGVADEKANKEAPSP
ncbi:MAG: conjugal transfer protein [Lautropia sp.]|nr:conjugal transfer protein [Lautropia sp.]MCL4700488.1 conjugal transfer protein [Burkholderiaceae bacterium]MCZ2099292.1 conjugal transfer protein [Anaerolineae bacterium]MDL1905910.1 conjugal transfer protein [Betaproteobacteria bacterium PRO1]RIK91167.1 MAG: conjugal transfer protein [Burkholderiales bacterium]